MTVPARMSVATLGARNLSKLREFYGRFGWPVLVDSDDFVAFRTQGALLALFGLDDLAADASAEANAPEAGLRGFTLAINVASRAEVDAAIAMVRQCGGRITKEPVDATLFDGRSAYFADPEDNHWEVVYFGGAGEIGDAIRRIIDVPTDDAAAVREVIERWAGAVRRKDYPAILACHVPDIVMFDVTPPFLSRGIDAYRKTWDAFFGWSNDPVRFDIGEMTVTAGADVAFVAATMGCAGPAANGAPNDLAFRLTVGLRKIDGRWLITHEHHSVPAVD
jgi:uncharacterized protein (TIGR02246 family)